MRAPSSLNSTVTSVPRSASAASSEEPGLASIGRTGRPTSRRTASSASTPPASASGRGRREPAGEHERPADARGRDLGRRGDRVQHHALQRALPELAGEQPDEEPLLWDIGVVSVSGRLPVGKGRRQALACVGLVRVIAV